MTDFLVIALYATFAIDFIICPAPSEVSTLAIVKHTDRGVSSRTILLVLTHLSILLLWLVPLVTALINITTYSNTPMTGYWWLGYLVAICGRLMTISASIVIRLHGLGALIRHSLFEHSRHPIVTGLHLTLAGLLLISGPVQLWCLYLVSLFYFDYKIRIEEQNLVSKFGATYIDYIRNTPRYLLW